MEEKTETKNNILGLLSEEAKSKVEVYTDTLIYLRDGRILKQSGCYDEYRDRKHPYGLFRAGGFPHVSHLLIEVVGVGQRNDLASLAFVLPDGSCKFCADADLMSQDERDFIAELCQRWHDEEKYKQPYLYD